MRLADHTTIRLGGPARDFVSAGTEQDLIEAVSAADARGEPLLILGGGSNLVVADEGFDGTVVQVATRGVRLGPEPGTVTVAAGEDWDSVVAGTIAAGLAGRFLTEWAGDPGAVTEFGVRFSAPVVVPDDDKGATVEVTGTVTERLDGQRVAVDVTARSDGTKVLTRARAVVRLA